jgi:hypothetical protein
VEYKVKLGATLTFDFEIEKDIVAQVEKLKSQHKLGEFISNALRVVFEHPELLEKEAKSLEDFKLTDNRKLFNEYVEDKIEKTAVKINETYKLAYELHSLAKFNKKFDMYETSKNILASQFILAKQVEDLKKILGVTTLEQTVNLHKVNTNIDDVLEYIIMCHGEIVEEIRGNATGRNAYLEKLEELNSLLDKHKEEVAVITENQSNTGKTADIEASNKKEMEESTHVSENNASIEEDEEIDGFGLSDDADLAGLVSVLNIV